MNDGRRADAAFKFNGKNVSTILRPYLETVTYTDIAASESDELNLTLQNVDGNWLNQWYPTKGDKIVGTFNFYDWDKPGEDKRLPLGKFTLDSVKFSGGPMTAVFECVATPNDESFHIRERTKTWKDITVQGIGAEISSRYGLQYSYTGPTIRIQSLEQSDQTDSGFLINICDTYGLSVKVYAGAIHVYDQTEMEQKKTVATIDRASFIGDDWEFCDTLTGIYTGARIAYKADKEEDKEISLYVGLKAEKAKGSRVLRISETVDSAEDARRKAIAQVNKSNEEAMVLSGTIWPNMDICSGVTVKVKDLGKASGKYFVDKSEITIDASQGTTQRITMHKCQPRLR